jgi:hypothetical protein
MFDFEFNFVLRSLLSPPQWTRDLRYKMFSSTQTLQSWLRILLEAGMSVRVSCVFGLSSVGYGFVAG